MNISTGQQADNRISNHFPVWVRDALIKASAISNPLERIREIDRIMEAARHRHPELFK